MRLIDQSKPGRILCHLGIGHVKQILHFVTKHVSNPVELKQKDLNRWYPPADHFFPIGECFRSCRRNNRQFTEIASVEKISGRTSIRVYKSNNICCSASVSSKPRDS